MFSPVLTVGTTSQDPAHALRWKPRLAMRTRALILVAMGACALALLAAWVVPQVDWRLGGERARPQEVQLALAPPPVPEQRLLPVSVEKAQVINAQREIVVGRLVAAPAYRFSGGIDARARAVDCLAAAAWYEIGNDQKGQRAVIQVVLNRARHPAYPGSLCGVVFQGSDRSTGCQFTFTCDGSILRRRPSLTSWNAARAVATAAIDGAVLPDVGQATNYHANYVVPYWASSIDKIAQVGPHIFYAFRGFWGTRAALSRRVGAEEQPVLALSSFSAAHAAAATGQLPYEGLTDGPQALADPSAEAGKFKVPEVVAVEGVREKSLRGALVRGHAKDTNRFFLQVDSTTFPGNYATAAVALCKDKPDCLVLGWRDATAMASALPLNEGQQTALSFYFSKNDGSYVVQWNCDQIARANKAQCLPKKMAALRGGPESAENSAKTKVLTRL